MTKPTVVHFDTWQEYADLYDEIESYRDLRYARWQEYTRAYGERDLFYLLRYILSTRNPEWRVRDRQALDHDFPLWFCRRIELEDRETDTLHIFSREHLKSTVGTFGRRIQIALANPNLTTAILSDALPLPLGFLRRIMTEFEKNPLLFELWPDVCWENPRRQAPMWSTGDTKPGMILNRRANVPEPTLTAVGLDTAIQTGPHYDIRCYDDIVTRRNTRNPQLMKKTRENLKASYSLGKEGGWATYYGTFYHPLDAYHDMLNDPERPEIELVKVPCYREPEIRQDPVYYSGEYLEKKERECGIDEFAIQWLLNPSLAVVTKMDAEWVRYYNPQEEVPVN